MNQQADSKFYMKKYLNSQNNFEEQSWKTFKYDLMAYYKVIGITTVS